MLLGSITRLIRSRALSPPSYFVFFQKTSRSLPYESFIELWW